MNCSLITFLMAIASRICCILAKYLDFESIATFAKFLHIWILYDLQSPINERDWMFYCHIFSSNLADITES